MWVDTNFVKDAPMANLICELGGMLGGKAKLLQIRAAAVPATPRPANHDLAQDMVECLFEVGKQDRKELLGVTRNC